MRSRRRSSASKDDAITRRRERGLRLQALGHGGNSKRLGSFCLISGVPKSTCKECQTVFSLMKESEKCSGLSKRKA